MNEKTLPTPEELRREWIAALRSGEFKQGKRSLCAITDDGDRYCCMGVLCELFRQYGTIPVGSDLTGDVHRRTYGADKWFAVPPMDVSQYVRLYGDGRDRLIRMNDSDEKTFSEIADELEKHPEKFFQLEPSNA